MTTKKINTAKLRQAINEFGTLQEAIDKLTIQKTSVEAKLAALTKEVNDKEYKSKTLNIEIEGLKKTILLHRQDLAYLQKTIADDKKQVEEYRQSIKQFIYQYQLFESFLAILQSSPLEKKSIKDLAVEILMIGETTWTFSEPSEKMRWLFTYTVLGKHLHCYSCTRCETKFIVNKEPRSNMIGYHCPVCSSSYSVRADNSFLEAMLQSGDNRSLLPM